MVSASSIARAMLRGQVALVTGASRGIGKGIALRLGQAGATVYVTGRSPDKQESISGALKLPSLNETAQEVAFQYSYMFREISEIVYKCSKSLTNKGIARCGDELGLGSAWG